MRPQLLNGNLRRNAQAPRRPLVRPRCSICYRTFSTAANLRRHQTFHTGIRPFRCNVCCNRFRRKDHLCVHLMTHSVVQHQCSHCRIIHYSEFDINEHLRQSDHPEAIPVVTHICPICPRRVDSKIALRSHLMDRHGAAMQSDMHPLPQVNVNPPRIQNVVRRNEVLPPGESSSSDSSDFGDSDDDQDNNAEDGGQNEINVAQPQPEPDSDSSSSAASISFDSEDDSDDDGSVGSSNNADMEEYQMLLNDDSDDEEDLSSDEDGEFVGMPPHENINALGHDDLVISSSSEDENEQGDEEEEEEPAPNVEQRNQVGDNNNNEAHPPYHCNLCGITYQDWILYFLHKGCHSIADPWRCSICGESCADRFQFNSHLFNKRHE